MTTKAPMFAVWMDDFFASYYRHRPVNATFIGEHDFDHLLPDFSENGAGDCIGEMAGLLDRLRSLPPESLAPMECIDRTLAEGFLRIQDWEYRSNHFHRGNPSLYTGEAVFSVIGLLLNLSSLPLKTRAAAAIERMHAMPDFLATAKGNLHAAPRAWTQRAIRECDGGLALFGEGIDQLIADERVPRRKLRAAADVAATAIADFRAFLQDDLLIKTNELYGCGEAALDLIMRQGHFFDLDGDEVVTYAETAMAEADAYLAEHAGRLGAASPEAALAKLADLHPSADGYYTSYTEVWNACRETAIAHDLVTWPDFPIEYLPRPAWSRDAAPYLYFLFYRSPATLQRPDVHQYLVSPLETTGSPAEIEAWDTYSEWLDSVSIRYTQLASGIEFLREELRQFRRANGFAGSSDGSERLQWAEDGLRELFRAASEIRYGFALAEEEGRRDCVLGDDAYQGAQSELEAQLTSTLTQIAELRKRIRELQDRLNARLAQAHPWVREYAIAPPRLPAERIGDAPVFCATQSRAVDWEPIQHLALDGVQVQTWAHSLSMVKSCLPDGSVDFSNFDDTLEEAAQHGARISVWVLAGGGPGAFLPYVLPRWFRTKHGDDLYCRDEAGKIYKGTVSMWHPAVRTMYRDFVGAFAERYKNDPRVVAYHFLDEASPNPRAGLMGYSATARAAFRKYLRDKYETIAALNAVWGRRYRDFADIDPPPEDKRRAAVAGTPHVNEFALFIDRSWQDFMNSFIDAFRAHDTIHPIAGQALNLGIDPTAQRWTGYGVNTGGGVGKHHFEYRLNRTYVVNRHVKDRLTYHLAWWAMDEGDYGAVPDQVMRNVYLRNLWQIFMWDSVGATLYSMRYRRDGWNMLDKATDYRLIRDSVATTPVMKSKLGHASVSG